MTAEAPPCQILLVDDHPVIRQGLRILLSQQPAWTVVGEANTGVEALSLVESLRPTLIVMDMQMPGMGGMEAVTRLKKTHPKLEIIIFSATDSCEQIQQVLASGARTYLLKSDAADHMVPAVQAALNGRPYFSERVSEILFARILARSHDSASAVASIHQLSQQERETLQLLASGKTNKEVGAALNLSTKAIEKRRAALMKKLGLQTYSDLVRFAVREGLVNS